MRGLTIAVVVLGTAVVGCGSERGGGAASAVPGAAPPVPEPASASGAGAPPPPSPPPAAPAAPPDAAPAKVPRDREAELERERKEAEAYAAGLIGGGDDPRGRGGFRDIGEPFDSAAAPPGRVRIASIEVQGALDPEVAEARVREHEASLAGCLREVLRADPDASVRVHALLVIDPRGRVERVSTTAQRRIGDAARPCLASTGAGIAFPAGDGETRVEVTLEVGPP